MEDSWVPTAEHAAPQRSAVASAGLLAVADPVKDTTAGILRLRYRHDLSQPELMTPARSTSPDRPAAAPAGGFVVLLVATELVLSLPDDTAGAAEVAVFYAARRTLITALQVLGFGAAVLLGGYAWRLRRVDRVVSAAGMVWRFAGWFPSWSPW
jgi:hypothetical protein